MNIIIKIQNSFKHWWSSDPRNLRSYTINNHEVWAMAQPSKQALPRLRKQGIDHIIALLDSNHQQELHNNYKDIISWDHFTTNDFINPDPDDFNNFNSLLDERLNSNKKVVVHCGAGNGRSGTYLAGYWLAKNITPNTTLNTDSLNYSERLSIFDTRHLSGIFRKIYQLLLKLLYGFDKPDAQDELAVWQITIDAVKFIKANAPEAVETPGQLRALQTYTEHLVSNLS